VSYELLVQTDEGDLIYEVIQARNYPAAKKLTEVRYPGCEFDLTYLKGSGKRPTK